MARPKSKENMVVVTFRVSERVEKFLRREARKRKVSRSKATADILGELANSLTDNALQPVSAG